MSQPYLILSHAQRRLLARFLRSLVAVEIEYAHGEAQGSGLEHHLGWIDPAELKALIAVIDLGGHGAQGEPATGLGIPPPVETLSQAVIESAGAEPPVPERGAKHLRDSSPPGSDEPLLGSRPSAPAVPCS